jgi:predicted Fe-Mo cluster-binding NifX family protein
VIVALALEKDEKIAQHFGRCATFRLVRIEGGRQVAVHDLPSPRHQPGLLPRVLKEYGVDVVVAGGMGGSAQGLFQQYGIETVVGVAGDGQSIIEQFVRGQLRSTGEVCREHSYEDECGK